MNPIVRGIVPTGILLVLGLICAAGAMAQTVSQAVFLPQQYYAGDIVEARVVVRGTVVPERDATQPLPSLPWVEVIDVFIVQRADGYEVRIRFQPFFVGTRRLPPIQLGEVTIDNVSAFVGSVLTEDDAAPAGMRDQLLLPGTRLLLILIVVAAIAVPTVVFVAGDWGRRTVRHLVRWYRERIPYRRFLRGLRVLSGRIHEIDAKRFYMDLQQLTREFMDRRFHAGLRAATTGELEDRLSRIGIPEDSRERLREMFEVADLVRYANRRVSLEERTAHLEDLRVITRELHRKKTEAPHVGA